MPGFIGMGSSRKYILFIDDCQNEVETFRRLYEGKEFKVTTLCLGSPSRAVTEIKRETKTKVPDLFVLDLFFPEVDDPPLGLDVQFRNHIRQRLLGLASRVKGALHNLKDGDTLLREAHGIVSQSEDLLQDCCEELRQSATGGILILKQLDKMYPRIPKVFYSRKATISDVKSALKAGALDVIRKPHCSSEESEAIQISSLFSTYCNWQAPSFLEGWLRKVDARVKWSSKHTEPIVPPRPNHTASRREDYQERKSKSG